MLHFIYYYYYFFFQILTVGADVGQVNAGKKVMPLIV